MVYWIVSSDTKDQGHHTMVNAFRHTPVDMAVPGRQDVHKTAHSWYNYTDTMNGHYKSLDGNKHAQIFANESFFATAYPMEHKSSTGQALKQFISDFGTPDKLVCDNAAEQVGKQTEFQSTVRKHAIDHHVTEPHCHNQSKVEGVVREIRKRWFHIMLKKKVLKRLWDYGIKWVCEVMQCTASVSGDLSGQTVLEQLTCYNPNQIR